MMITRKQLTLCQAYGLTIMLVLGVASIVSGQPRQGVQADEWSSDISQVRSLIRQGDIKEARKRADGLVDQLVKTTDATPRMIQYAVPLETLLSELDHKEALDRLSVFVAGHFKAVPLEQLSGVGLVSYAHLMKRAGRTDHLGELAERGSFLIRQAEINRRVVSLPLLENLDRVAQLSGSQELTDQIARQRESIDFSDAEARLNLAPFELMHLAARYHKTDAAGELDELARFIVRDYLPHPGVAAAVMPSEWLDLAGIVLASHDQDTRDRMADLLNEAVRQGRLPVSHQSPIGLKNLVEAVEGLRGIRNNDFRGLVTSRWLGIRGGWQELSDDTRRQLIAVAIGDRKAWDKLASSLSKLHARGELGHAEYITMVFACARLRLGKEAQAWGRRLAESKWLTEEAYGVGDTQRIAATLIALSRSGVALSEAQADNVISLIQHLDPVSTQVSDRVYAAAAAILTRSSSLPALEAVQNHDDGTINLAVAKTRSWALVNQGEALQFAKDLKTQVPNDSGDTLAIRWLAITYAVSVHYDDPPRTAGMTEYLGMALKAAETDAARMRVLDELASMAFVNGNTEYALGVIQGVQPQFSGTDHARLAEWANRLERLEEVRARQTEKSLETRPFASLFGRKRREF